MNGGSSCKQWTVCNLFNKVKVILIISIVNFVVDDPYFGTGDDDMEDLESDQASPTDKSCLLLEFILQCLSKCFLYDKGGNFLTKERFDTLVQPLVDQVKQYPIGLVYMQITCHGLPTYSSYK